MNKTIFWNAALGAAKYLAFCTVVFILVLFSIYHTGCQITSEGIKVLDGSESPEIQSVSVLDENSLEVQFNKKVSVKSARVSKLDSGQSASLDQIFKDAVPAEGRTGADETKIVYNFSQSTKIGQRYQLFSEIKDARGNSLTFAVPFEGYNDHVPILVLAEVQGKNYTANLASGKTHRCEYIVLRALTSGNLGGLELSSARYKELSGYQFPCVEVKAGEHIMVHLRTYDGVSFTNELESNTALDKGAGSKGFTRDLYFENSKKCVGETYDIILLRNKSTMQVLDALIYSTESEKEKLEPYSKAIKDAAPHCEKILIKDSALGTTATKCLVRQNTNELLDLVQQEKLTQNQIAASNGDWRVDLSLYNSKRK